ncbi:putative reverse transcriptase domain protein, partial [Rhizoctonia solani 123E]
MARRAAKPPRCNNCIRRGRHSKCDRKTPCSACVKDNTAEECSYGELQHQDAPPPPPPAQRARLPPSPRGIRRPVARDTPSNASIQSRSTLSPPPPLPLANAVPQPLGRIPVRFRSDSPQARGATPQGDPSSEIKQLQAQLIILQQQVRQRELDNDPIYRRAESEVRAQPSISEIIRKAVTPGVQAPAIQTMVSPTITHIFKTGWHFFVPISMLTTRYRQLHSGQYHSEMNVIKWNSKGQALVKDTTRLSDAGDFLLTIDEWVDGWKFHLWLVEKYQPNVAQAWADHYSLIFHDATFHTEFDLWLCYDITVRKRWIDEGFDPGTFQKKIYKMIDRELTRAARDGLTRSRYTGQTPQVDSYDRSAQPRSAEYVPYASTQHPDCSGPSRASGNRNSTSTRYHPYKQPNSSHPRPSDGTGTPVRCLHCGGSGHPPPSCNASTRANDDSVTTSMAPKDATLLTAHTDRTSAPSVVPLDTQPNPARIDPRKIITPLIPDAWHSVLHSLNLLDKFSDVPVGLRHGFRFGASHALSTTSIPPNHKSAQDAPEVIDAHISKELSLGRYSGPFDHSHLFRLIGHFRSAPLGLVSKVSSPGE